MRVVSTTRATCVGGSGSGSRPATGGRLTEMGLAIARTRAAEFAWSWGLGGGGTY